MDLHAKRVAAQYVIRDEKKARIVHLIALKARGFDLDEIVESSFDTSTRNPGTKH